MKSLEHLLNESGCFLIMSRSRKSLKVVELGIIWCYHWIKVKERYGTTELKSKKCLGAMIN